MGEKWEQRCLFRDWAANVWEERAGWLAGWVMNKKVRKCICVERPCQRDGCVIVPRNTGLLARYAFAPEAILCCQTEYYPSALNIRSPASGGANCVWKNTEYAAHTVLYKMFFSIKYVHTSISIGHTIYVPHSRTLPEVTRKQSVDFRLSVRELLPRLESAYL